VNSTSDSEENRNVSNKLIGDFLVCLKQGEPGAGFDLARILLGALPVDDAETALAVIEALITQSAQLGCSDARLYLDEKWPKMREASVKRLRRRGYK